MKYNLVNFCEFDKEAVKSYCAIHNVSADKNLGDITKVKELPNCDLLTYGFPCQDISTFGNRQGIVNGERSGLLGEVKRLLECSANRPKFLLMENVKALIEKNNLSDFQKWLLQLEEFGYVNYYKVLNSSDYGIPQRRNRLFCLSVRKDLDVGFAFPEKKTLTLLLSDIIDKNSDENLYGKPPSNEHQEWKQAMFKRYIEESCGVCCGVYTNQSKFFGYRPPLKNIAKTIKANAFDTGFVMGDIVRDFTAEECWKLQGFDNSDFEKASAVAIKKNSLKK